MNAWDYHILKCLGLWLAVFTPLAFLLWALYDHLKGQHFWIAHPWMATIDLFLGPRYAVRVNGVWSLCRGRLSRSGYYLFIKYGKDGHKWELEHGNFDEIKPSFTEKEAQQFVIERNVKDLKRKHPKKVDTKNRRFIVVEGRSYINPYYTSPEEPEEEAG